MSSWDGQLFIFVKIKTEYTHLGIFEVAIPFTAGTRWEKDQRVQLNFQDMEPAAQQPCANCDNQFYDPEPNYLCKACR